MAVLETRSVSEPAPSSAFPETSLILCSRNRPQLLEESVRSILEGDQAPTELIIVDQSDKANSTLSGFTTDRACDIQYTWTHTVGLSRAMNLGISLARYDILVFTHDDVLVDRQRFGELTRSLVDAGRRTIVTGQVLPGEAQSKEGFVPTIKVGDTPAVYQGRVGRDVLLPLSMAMYRQTVTEIGSFDERLGPGTPFPGAEDNDFGYRLLEAGYKICYIPSSVLYHRAWRPARDYLPLRWAYGVARGAMYAKYSSLRDQYMLRRMLRDVRLHFMLVVTRPRSERRQAFGDAALGLGILFGDAALGLGILFGAGRWLLAQRKKR